MSDERPTERRITIKPQPVNRVVTDRLSHPATVGHPTMAGDGAEFEVVIERIYYRPEDDGTERLCFRGKATAGSWTGYKTFFADECLSVIDRSTGSSVANITEWLQSLHASPDPLTLNSLMKAVSDYLNSELGIKIGRMGARVSPDGVRISYTEITSTDPEEANEAPYAELQIFLDGVAAGACTDPITTDPLVVTVAEPQAPSEATTREIDGIVYTETTRRIPMGLTVEVTPCAGGRVDVRPVPRGRSRL